MVYYSCHLHIQGIYNSLTLVPSHSFVFISINPPTIYGLGTTDYGYFTDKETKPQGT